MKENRIQNTNQYVKIKKGLYRIPINPNQNRTLGNLTPSDIYETSTWRYNSYYHIRWEIMWACFKCKNEPELLRQTKIVNTTNSS